MKKREVNKRNKRINITRNREQKDKKNRITQQDEGAARTEGKWERGNGGKRSRKTAEKAENS